MPTPTLERPAPRVPTRDTDYVAFFVLATMAVALLFAVSTLLHDVDRADVELENPTAYDITVRVASADGGSDLVLGTLAPGATKTFTGVIDQGDRWRFDFTYGGVDAGGFDLDADAATGAPVTVPDSVADALQDAGLGESSG